MIERCGAVFDRMAKGDLTASLEGLPSEYQALADSFRGDARTDVRDAWRC